MVWIHGGANLAGAGSEDLYDGARLASQGATVVTLNYRLGAFGFLAHPDFGAWCQVMNEPSWSQSTYSICWAAATPMCCARRPPMNSPRRPWRCPEPRRRLATFTPPQT
jgi:hypothetical protein